MSILNSSKFDVVRGWTPGGDASVDPAIAPGAGLTFSPGMFGHLHTDGTLVMPDAPGAGFQPLYCVINGNTADEYDTNEVGKVQCLRGNFTIKTDVYVAAGLAVGGPLTVDASGQLIAAGGNFRVGFVLEDNTLIDGTIVAEINI